MGDVGETTSVGNINFNKNAWLSKCGAACAKGSFKREVDVHVKRMPLKDNLKISRELEALEMSGSVHENIIRFIGSESDASYTYIATELCICSVADLYREHDKYEKIRDSLSQKSMLQQMSEAVFFLHSLGLIHRNLKPNNFVIAEVAIKPEPKYLIKLTDMSKSKNIRSNRENSGTLATDSWIAPEMGSGTTLDEKMDTFVLGCVFYYVASEGTHPFGSGIVREINIQSWQYEVYSEKWDPKLKEPQLGDLIKKTIKFHQDERPTMGEVLKDPYFKPLEDELYDLYGKGVKAGLCLIINQKDFPNKQHDKERLGTDKDCEALKNSFTKLGFDVLIRTNVEGYKLEWEMLQLARAETWNTGEYASLVVCILSHGSEGIVEGVDGVLVEVKKLKYAFNSQNCPGLHGKPKVFVIQACRGSFHQRPEADCLRVAEQSTSGRVAEKKIVIDSKTSNEEPLPKKAKEASITDAVPVSSEENKGPSNEEMVPEFEGTRPPVMDFLDLMSTIEDYYCYRFENDGSPFIQKLCEKLNCQSTDIFDTFRDIQKELGNMKIWIEINPSGPSSQILVRQVCELRTSLAKKLVFQQAESGREGKALPEENFEKLIAKPHAARK